MSYFYKLIWVVFSPERKIVSVQSAPVAVLVADTESKSKKIWSHDALINLVDEKLMARVEQLMTTPA